MQATLVDQAKRGDAEAFDSLARMVGDRCMAIAFRILRDADLAEDAVQTAFITAWRELRSLHNPDRFDTLPGRGEGAADWPHLAAAQIEPIGCPQTL